MTAKSIIFEVVSIRSAALVLHWGIVLGHKFAEEAVGWLVNHELPLRQKSVTIVTIIAMDMSIISQVSAVVTPLLVYAVRHVEPELKPVREVVGMAVLPLVVPNLVMAKMTIATAKSIISRGKPIL